MEKKKEIFEVEDSFPRDNYTVATALIFATGLPIVFLMLIFMVAFIINIQTALKLLVVKGLFIIGFISINLAGIGIHFTRQISKFSLPNHKIKFLINNEEIKIYFLDHLYKHYDWIKITKIEIKKERYYHPLFRFLRNRSYQISIITNYETESMRLFALRFRKENYDPIIEALQKFSINKKIEITIFPGETRISDTALREERLSLQKIRLDIRAEGKLKIEKGVIIAYLKLLISTIIPLSVLIFFPFYLHLIS